MKRHAATSLLAGGVPLLVGCGSPTSALDPRGPGAARIADLWWLMLALAVGVGVAVVALLLVAVVRARSGQSQDQPGQPGQARPPVSDTTLIVVGGIIVPAVILLVLVVATIRTGVALSAPANSDALTIEVIGHQFWWEVRYTGTGVVTANEIHIPAGAPVRLLLQSTGVIHSLWVPPLNGKQDLIPGKTNVLQLEATEPGTYRGFCAEFCGIQHTLMQLLIVAQPAEEFTAWLDERRRPPSPPADPLALEGQRLYTTTGCSSCHPIGDAARASVTGPAGPDLGHLATRRTLASGIVENSPANRAAWIVAPDAIKPGTTMPATSLDSEQLRALLAYLDTLR